MRTIVLLAALLLALPRLALAAYEPTTEESEHIAKLTAQYFDAVDRMDYAASWKMLAPSVRKQMPEAEWDKAQKEARAERGAPRERVQRLLSWELDPESSPAGLYVSVDLDSVHDVAKHVSEYVVWYRAPGAKEFQLLRHEMTEMRGVAKDSGGPSPHGNASDANPSLDAPVASPNVTTQAAPAPAHPSPHDARNSAPLPPMLPPPTLAETAEPIGFKTVAEARAALGKRDGAVATTDDLGWTVVSEGRTQTLWTFVPASHPAFPSLVRRQLVEREGTLFIEMETLCEAKKKDACDLLEREFDALNERAKSEIAASQKPAPST